MKYGELNLGQIEALVNRLGGMEGVQSLLRGQSQIVPVKHIIDCDSDPFVPEGWEVVEHKKGGQLEWNPSKVFLYLSDSQNNGKTIKGDKLRKELEEQPVLNANVLDYLLEHQDLIPESWKGKWIFFWGTIFRHPDGCLFVRCLRWNGDLWDWDCNWLDDAFDGDDPAVCSQVSS